MKLKDLKEKTDKLHKNKLKILYNGIYWKQLFKMGPVVGQKLIADEGQMIWV